MIIEEGPAALFAIVMEVQAPETDRMEERI